MGSSVLPVLLSGHDGERPRKRQNRGDSPPSPDPIDLFDTPGSPEIVRPGQRRKPNASVLSSSVSSSVSSDESLLESSREVAGPSKPRLVRGERTSSPALRFTPEYSHAPPQNDAKLNMFKFSHPEHPPARVVAAWQHSGGDEAKATVLLGDPSWHPPTPKPSPIAMVKRIQKSAELGRVKEVDDASKAERARVREIGRKSMIYAKPGSSVATPPTSKAIPNLVKSSSATPVPLRQPTPTTPDSPEVIRAPGKRIKRKVIESDSEPDYAESDEDKGDSEPDDANEQAAFDYLNSSSSEALQELTGM